MATKSKAKPRRKTAGRKAPSRRTAAARKASSGRASDLRQITEMLEDDHAKVKKLFKRYEKMKDDEDKKRFQLATEICTMLKVHATIEEELFYPAARDVLEDEDDLVDEAEVEHASAKQLIADIERMETSDPMYDAKVKVLGEYIEHHADEEEDEMFPKLKKKAEEQFEGMFGQMREMRQSLEQDLSTEGKKSRPARSAASERKSAELP